MDPMNEKVNQYIAYSGEFAVPILTHLRKIVHKACPEVKETIKWSFPHFEYRGSILCSMAAFKNHCAFSFWLGSQLSDTEKILETGDSRTAMGSLGRIRMIGDLPSADILSSYIREAMDLIDKGVKLPKKIKPDATSTIGVPDYFIEALETNKPARITFNNFSYSHKKEYINWIIEAKTEATRIKRIQTALEWLADGKPQNWRYRK